MDMIKRPMKAVELPTKNGKPDYDIPFSVIATPKVDGIRCIIINGKCLSARFKPIPNEYVQDSLSGLPSGLDGELVVWDEKKKRPAPFNETQSGIMQKGGKPNFRFLIFDYLLHTVHGVSTKQYYERRLALLKQYKLPSWCIVFKPTIIKKLSSLISYEKKAVSHGYEGVVLRTPGSPYKEGRSTLNEFWMVKWKRFTDSEAIVIGFEKRMHNTNEGKREADGYLRRSSCKSGKIQMDMAGKIIAKDINKRSKFYGRIIKVSGFGFDLAKDMIKNPIKYIGKIFTYKFQDYGTKDLPRILTFKGWRNDI